jgi:hypothetical protein
MEFSGFAGKFRCFCKEEFKDSLFSSPLFQTGSSIDAHRLLMSPQYVRRCEFRVIFAG